jgi:two-component system, sensor histidine kinase
MPWFEFVLKVLEPRDIKQLDLFARVGGLGVTLISIALATVMCIAFWDASPHAGIVVWMAVLIISRLGLHAVSVAFHRASPAQRAANRYWPLIATLCAGVSALIWGFAGFVLIAPHDVMAETMLHLILVTIVFLAVPNLANYYPTVVAYAVGVFVPLAVRNFMIGGEFHVALGVLSILASLYVAINGRSQALAIADALNQRRVNLELVNELQRENQAVNSARLLAEQAHASKSRFFAAANHDLRQPLHAIGLLSYTLQTHGDQTDVRELSRTIGQCVANMSAMMDELVELSNIDSGSVVPQFAPFALQDLVAALRTTFAPQAAAKRLTLKLDPLDATILSDEKLLTRILSNLLSNAIRYTFTGTVHLQLAKADDQIEVTVRDTGIGIAAHDHERIFEEFYQAGNPERDRSKGSGLGLATVRRLCNLLNLPIAVQSAPGTGSAFALRLPVASASVARARVAPVAITHVDLGGQLAGKTVLLIEDDGTAREAMHRLLAAWGCEVYPACSGQGALNLVGTGLQPEFVIADLRLSGTMNGCEALQKLHAKLGADIPAVIVTGDHQSELIALVEAANIPVLPKPVDPQLLQAMLVDAFASRAPAANAAH